MSLFMMGMCSLDLMDSLRDGVVYMYFNVQFLFQFQSLCWTGTIISIILWPEKKHCNWYVQPSKHFNLWLIGCRTELHV